MRGLSGPIAILSVLVLLSGCSAERSEGRFRVLASFAVTDTTPEVVRDLASGLRVRVRREGGLDAQLGWAVEVTRTGMEGAPDLLYHSSTWRGPYPSHLLAWSVADHRYPAERILPVHGHPYELRLRCIRCRTVGGGEAARFTSGTVEVSARRVRTPFPPADSAEGTVVRGGG